MYVDKFARNGNFIFTKNYCNNKFEITCRQIETLANISMDQRGRR